MRVFLQSIVAQLLLNPYIFYRGYQAIPPRKGWRVPYILFFIIELLLFFTGYFFHSHLPDSVMIGIMYICNTWYVASIYITLSLLVLEVVRLTNHRWKWFPRWITGNWKTAKLTMLVIIVTGATVLMIHAYRTVMNPVVTRLQITLPKGKSTRDSLRIAMMSDLHIGEIIGKKLVRKYVAMSNAEHPDIVVLVGDLMDHESRFAEMYNAEDDLRQLESPLGTYIVYGNHEYRANRHAKERWLRKTGSTLLVDSVVMPDSTFYLIGRDDYINKKRKPLQTLMRDVDKDYPVIVLDHQPWSLAELTMNGVDLGLHGHTHNGQLWPYSLLLNFVYEKAYGYHRKGHTQFYVSSGIGVAGTPYRVGTVSELVIIDITFK